MRILVKRFLLTSIYCVDRLYSSHCTAVSGNIDPPINCRPTVGKTLKKDAKTVRKDINTNSIEGRSFTCTDVPKVKTRYAS